MNRPPRSSPRTVSRIAWWARLGSRFRQYADDFDVRWIEPSGRIALERSAKKRSADMIGSVLEFGRKQPAVAGRWTLELVLEDDAVDRQTLRDPPESQPPNPGSERPRTRSDDRSDRTGAYSC